VRERERAETKTDWKKEIDSHEGFMLVINYNVQKNRCSAWAQPAMRISLE
jgi:hypothetical protein